jgi:hypothetical protein
MKKSRSWLSEKPNLRKSLDNYEPLGIEREAVLRLQLMMSLK